MKTVDINEVPDLPCPTTEELVARLRHYIAANISNLNLAPSDVPGLGGQISGGSPPLSSPISKLERNGSNGSNSVSPRELYDYLLTKGVGRIHALGMLANIKAESGFNAGAIGDSGASYGLFQHNLSRRDAMLAYIEKHYGSTEWSKHWKGQVDYALSEGSTKQYLSKPFLTPEHAVEWFMVYWERPADKSRAAIQKRQANLKLFNWY